jgi:hypothetical protein
LDARRGTHSCPLGQSFADTKQLPSIVVGMGVGFAVLVGGLVTVVLVTGGLIVVRVAVGFTVVFVGVIVGVGGLVVGHRIIGPTHSSAVHVLANGPLFSQHAVTSHTTAHTHKHTITAKHLEAC